MTSIVKLTLGRHLPPRPAKVFKSSPGRDILWNEELDLGERCRRIALAFELGVHDRGAVVSVPVRHLLRAISSDAHDLSRRQTTLEEAACAFVPQVMPMQIGDLACEKQNPG